MFLDAGVLIKEVLPLLIILTSHKIILLLPNKRLIIQLLLKVLLIASINIRTIGT
jgi:hypothetical protein